MLSGPRLDYTTVVVDDRGQNYNNSKSRRRQSCWRLWNQLSSLQRSSICMIMIICTLTSIYVFPSFYDDFMKKDDLDIMSRKQPPKPDIFDQNIAEGEKIKFQQKAVNDIQKKAEQALLDKNPGAVGNKRGPPQLKNRQVNTEAGPLGAVPPAQEEHFEQQAFEQLQSPDSQLIFSGPANPRQEAVVGAFRHAWSAYQKYAWGKDELLPMTKTSGTWFGVGLTLIDALDTMYIMGLKEEFAEARDWVQHQMTFDVNKDANLFEVTIRVLGGLLSTYHLTKDKLFLDKARDIGDRLMPAFSTQSKIPFSDVNLKTHSAHAPRWGPDSSTSEVTTIQLEFRDLSRVTGDPKYEQAVERVTDIVHKLPKKDGLVPIFINANTGKFRSSGTITLGARGDSYYEYLLKGWLQSGKTDDRLRDDYVEAVKGIKTHLMRESRPNKLLYFGELLGGHSFSPKMDHLVCYLGGALVLGAHHGLSEEHKQLGIRLTETCFEMYRKMPTGLSPEIVYFNMAESAPEDLIVKPADSHNLQRPETVESLFVLYRLTGDKKYQDWGWKIFQSFEKHTKLSEGYTSINNVKNQGNPGYRNKMESFFLGETLKYFYLLFSDDPDMLSLDKWVFNTEAHPLPIYTS